MRITFGSLIIGVEGCEWKFLCDTILGCDIFARNLNQIYHKSNVRPRSATVGVG